MIPPKEWLVPAFVHPILMSKGNLLGLTGWAQEISTC